MFRTIVVGSCVTIQGLFVKALSDGRIAVKDGDNIYVGRPANDAAA